MMIHVLQLLGDKGARDEWEEQSVHVLMLDENEEAIACGRLQINSKTEGQIRSMAVTTELQGKGLGKKIIQYIERRAKELNLNIINLDARINAVKFYESCGYQVVGESYLLFGIIPHFKMEKIIGDSLNS